MFEKLEANKYMDKQELATELSKIKAKLFCRKKPLLLEMGYRETSFFDLIESDTSECAIKGLCQVLFHRNYRTVKFSTLHFSMENKEQGEEYEKAVKRIANNVVEACAEVFGLHNITEKFPFIDIVAPEDKTIFQSEGILNYQYSGVSENNKIMGICILCDKMRKNEVAIFIGLYNLKGNEEKDGK